MKMKMLLLLLLLALSSSSLGADITLSSESSFIDLVNSVNTETTYLGTTVYLGSDLSFSGETIESIGKDSNQFRGVFDGQGHIISDLKIISSICTGLFGYSTGLTIRNVVLDRSCSIVNSYSGTDDVYVGGTIGKCYADSGECYIENSVNMAGVTFSGSISSNLYLGGIVGRLAYSSSSNYNVYVKNCVNYGPVTDLGTVGNYAEMGGVVGISDGTSSYLYIQNCLNYGTITHSGTSANLFIGGVVGNSAYYTYVENCVCAGKISTLTTATGSSYIGSVVGYVYTNIHINYCYYTSDVDASSIYGTGTPSSTTGTPSTPTDVDFDLVSNLNSNATSRDWNKWFILHLNGGSINNFTQDPLIGIQGHIPDPVKEGYTPSWYKDAECIEEFDPATDSVNGVTDLYAGWTPNNYTVTFDFGNGTTVNVTFSYNTEIIYPVVVKEGYTFNQWDNYHEFMPARDITVTAQWTPNIYTVTFDANGGNASETTKTVAFDEKYGELPKPKRTRCMFLGWFTDETNGIEVTNKTFVTTPHNHTLYAQWEEVTNHVEIVFDTKDLTKEEVKKLIEQYAKAGFEIVKYEEESEGIRVIIKFVDKEEAENFVRDAKESDRATNLIKRIKGVSFVADDTDSISAVTYPLSFLDFLFL